MSLKLVALFLSIAGIIGVAVGYYLRLIISLGKKGSMELEIKEMLLGAKEEATKITTEAEIKAQKEVSDARQEIKEREEKIQQLEQRLIKKEDLLDKRQLDIDTEIEQLKIKIAEIKTTKEKIDSIEKEKSGELARLSNLSREEAKEIIFEEVKRDFEPEILSRIQKFENFGEEKIKDRAKEILATTIQRLANSVASDIFSTTVVIPNEEIKGKVIGKEGRNIKAFERMSGVEIIVDDNPGTITLSSFDPIRREVGRVALEELIKDGRIQPAKIEKEIEKAQTEINQTIKEQGEKAAFECGVLNLDPRLLLVLGRLHYRTSYGHNVLQHSIEMSHIAGMIAEEIGANVQIAKTAALLHDIGKALDHEVAGTHVEIGRRILQKFNVQEEIIKAMQAHHEEYPYENLESRIVQTADAISGARPGARRDSVENYLKRLTDLENIATSYPGIEKAYALQAGREIRVFVSPEQVTDLRAKEIARDIANRIEKELRYPGEIKVHVIRENRIVEFAR